MPIVNRALIKAGLGDIRSIVTTFDSGGDSGRMRTDERGRILAFSDYWRSLISLWKDGRQKEVWEEMLRYRDGRGRNFGNTFFQFMAEKVGDLSGVDSLFSKLTGAKLGGQVVPVSLKPANVCFETETGKKYCGEHYLDDLRMSTDRVVDIWLEPEVEANPEAVESLKRAKVIIFCPGSIYGSVLVNLLPKGITEAYRESRAKKILLTNIVSMANEDDNYEKIFDKYLGKKNLFDVVIMADMSKLEKRMLAKTIESYEKEHSRLVKPRGKVIVADVAMIEEENLRLRHSVEKLAGLFSGLLK